MLTSIAADLSVRVLNYANLTEKHLPTVGQWVIIPDRILYKNLGSFSAAIGRVVKIENRTIYIKLANNQIINRASSDIIPCSSNKFDQISVDILDLPLFENNQEHFKNISSQHEIFLPTINLDQDSNNSNDVLQPCTAIPLNTEIDEIVTDPSYIPEGQQPEDMRPNTRPRRQSWRYTARYEEEESQSSQDTQNVQDQATHPSSTPSQGNLLAK